MATNAESQSTEEYSAISAAAARLACEVRQAWLARPWAGAGRVDRPTIDAFHKAAVDGDAELVGRMLDDAGRSGVSVLLESRNSAGWTPLMWASWHAQVRPASAFPSFPLPLLLWYPVLLWPCAERPTQPGCGWSRRYQLCDGSYRLNAT